MDNALRSKNAKRVTLVGAAINLLLALLKLTFGILGRSQGLFADGIHSLSDLLTDGLVMLASHFASRDADADHPYGHQRIETAATMVLAALLVVTGTAIIYDAVLAGLLSVQPEPKKKAKGKP